MNDVPFDLFLPKPSLSTTSFAHCILRRVLGVGPAARRRRTGVEVCVCVVVVVEVVEWMCECEACWWDGGAIVAEMGVKLCKEEGFCSCIRACICSYKE